MGACFYQHTNIQNSSPHHLTLKRETVDGLIAAMPCRVSSHFPVWQSASARLKWDAVEINLLYYNQAVVVVQWSARLSPSLRRL